MSETKPPVAETSAKTKAGAGDSRLEDPLAKEVTAEEVEIAAAVDKERFDAEKLHLYEQFVQGKIKRGALDRELDALYLRRQKTGPSETPAKTARQPEAESIVHKARWWAAGVGLIPFPVVDLAALTTVQVVMLRKLCDLYEVPFSEHWGRNVVSALVGSVIPSQLKTIPGVTSLVGILASPGFNLASTHAVGKVFIQHFESGGTLLTFEPARMKNYFREYYESGRTFAKAA